MATLKFEKRNTSLPTPLQPNTMYFVKNGSTVIAYLSDSTGTTAYPISPSGAASADVHPFLLMGAGNA